MSIAPFLGKNLVRLVYLDEGGTDLKAPVLTVAGVLVHGDQQWPEIDRRILARRANRGVASGAADVIEFERIELIASTAEQRLKRNTAVYQPDDGAVFWCRIIEAVGDQEPTGAGHVLRNHGGIAGKVSSEMTRDGARPQVVLATDAKADQNRDSPAGEEIVSRRCAHFTADRER